MTTFEERYRAVAWPEYVARAPWLLRLPVIRHVRWFFNAWGLERHNRLYRGLGMIPGENDQLVLLAIWRGDA